jgi:ABC-type sulfate transport system permease component
LQLGAEFDPVCLVLFVPLRGFRGGTLLEHKAGILLAFASGGPVLALVVVSILFVLLMVAPVKSNFNRRLLQVLLLCLLQ